MLHYPISGTNYTIGNHPNVLGWDLFNEPEWGIIESGAVNGDISQPVSLAEMRRFVAEVSAAIHHNSNQLVTLGSASMQWNSEGALGAIGNWWSDAALKFYDPDGFLDFYQVHYYSWMSGNRIIWSYSPLFNTLDAAGFDKPTVIGEFPADATGTGHTPAEILNAIYNNGYAGAWAWSYERLSSFGSWLDSQNAYTSFNFSHPTQVKIECNSFLPSIRKLEK